MSDRWYGSLPRSSFSNLKRITSSVEWFEIYEVTPNTFIFYEPRHFEEAISNLLIGNNQALLIDTGCGIGDLYKAVKEITDKPILIVNTHTHSDHLGNNWQFSNIALLEHPQSRDISANGIPNKALVPEILDEKLIVKPWPENFDPEGYSIPPFEVGRWLHEGDLIQLGNRDLEVIHTPGEAPNHICLLDRSNRMLFSGDILLKGPIWTHLEGGNLQDLKNSYHKLLRYMDYFDHIMPSHNETFIDKDLLSESLSGAEAVLSGQTEYQIVTDIWNRTLRKYSFNRLSILTPS